MLLLRAGEDVIRPGLPLDTRLIGATRCPRENARRREQDENAKKDRFHDVEDYAAKLWWDAETTGKYSAPEKLPQRFPVPRHGMILLDAALRRTGCCGAIPPRL